MSSDRATEKQHEEDQARVVKLQAAVEAQTAKLDTIVLMLQVQVEHPSPSSPYAVRLLWNPSTTRGVIGYNVYRSRRPRDLHKARVNDFPLKTTFYLDNDVQPGQTYYYAVTAITSLGQESAFSNEIQKVVPAAPE